MFMSRIHYGYVILAMIALVTLSVLGLGRFGYSVVLPAMQESLQLSNTQAGELQSWNLLGYLVGALGAGMLAARFGSRIVIATALFVAALAMLLTGLAPGVEVARWTRALTGLGAGGAIVPALALTPAWFATHRRGTASGIAVSGTSLGLIISGPLVPWLIATNGRDLGWRASWLAFGALALLIAIFVTIFLRDRPAQLGLHPVGAEHTDVPHASAFAAEWHHLLRTRALWHLSALYVCFGFSYTIYYTFFVRFLVGEGGWSQADAGALWFQIGVASIISGFVWGAVSDRWGRRVAFVGVFLFHGAAFLLFGLTPWSAGFFLSAFLYAVSAWSVPALMAVACGDQFGVRLAPVALGIATMVFSIGQAIAPVLAGAIADTTQKFAPAFILAGGVAWLGALMAWRLSPAKK